MILSTITNRDEVVRLNGILESNKDYSLYYLDGEDYLDSPIFDTPTDINLCNEYIDVISVDDDNNLLGRFTARIDDRKVSCVDLINFTGKRNHIFSKDLSMFFDMIINFAHEIEWDVIVGNPAERMTHTIIKKYNMKKHLTISEENVIINHKEFVIRTYQYKQGGCLDD